MKLHISLFLILISLSSHLYTSSDNCCFEHRQVSADSAQHEVQIKYFVNKQHVGSISFAKVPFINAYALHSLYVYPEYRNKGYGTQLLNHACDYLKSIDAENIYIQPGPFEVDEDGHLDRSLDSRESKLQRLVALYTKNQFHFTPKWATPIIWLLYKAMRIDENAEYLMVKKL